MTAPEIAIWQALRQRPGQLKFRRQHPVGPYVIDFCCLSNRIAVEIDGFAHDNPDQARRDGERDRFLHDNGFRVLRIRACEVLDDVDAVVAAIVASAASPLHRPADGPPPRAGED